MHIDQRKQQYSFAYVRAVAAAAGFGVNEASVDDDSIDLQIASRTTAGTTKRPRLELQAKCYGDGEFAGDSFGYVLKLKNYDDLRDPDVQVPRILVVVRVPEDAESWLGGDDKVCSSSIADTGVVCAGCPIMLVWRRSRR